LEKSKDTPRGEIMLTMVAIVEDKKDQDATENVGTLGVGSGVGVANSHVEPQVDASLPCQPAQNNDGEAGENEPDDEVDSSSAKDDIDSDESENDKNSTERNEGVGFIRERRSSKRQRASASNRYSPGEGGGLAYKKPKPNSLRATSGPGNTIKNEETKAQPPSHGGGDNAKTNVDKKVRHEEGGSEGSPEKTVRELSKPSYRWIDEGTKSDATRSSIEYEGLEIDFTNMKTTTWTPQSPFVVRLGDAVTISSDSAPWYDSIPKKSDDVQNCEAIPIYKDLASRGPGLGALDPYIGVVERLWEETEDPSKIGFGQRKKKGKSTKSFKSTSRMMMRTRWFFKKEDLEGIRGSFVVEGTANGGGTKDELLSKMSSQDLVLTDQSDDNVVTSIIGKARVVKRKAGDQSIEEDRTDLNGCFVCRYNLTLCLADSHGKDDMAAKLIPWTDDTDVFTDFGEVSNTITDNYGCNLARNDNNYVTPFSPSSLTMSPRRVVSGGGAFLGKIRIGDHHQAEIPPQLDLQRKVSFRGLVNPPSQRIPALVWDPANDEGNHVDDFLEEACSLLGNHMKTVGLEPFHDANYIGSLDAEAEAKTPREIDIVSLLTELHVCRGDARKAIKRIEDRPEMFMTIWNKKDTERFDASYRIYRESIRMIANTLGERNCKEVVDYQYRFKYCENFRRFMRKKREKAEEIMATVEDRMLNEKMKEDEKKVRGENDVDSSVSSEEEGKVSASTIYVGGGTEAGREFGPVNNRVRTWFRTGGGVRDAVGANQQRRNVACGILAQVRERIGDDAYQTLAKSIKACCNSNQMADGVLLDVKSTAEDIMKSHPDLLERFMAFLPKEIRCS
jgi:hypothetical protein